MTLEVRLGNSRKRRQSETPTTGRFLARTSSDPKKELAAALLNLQEAFHGDYVVLYGMRKDGPDFHTCMIPNDERLPERVSKLFSGPVLIHTYDENKGLIRDYYQRT